MFWYEIATLLVIPAAAGGGPTEVNDTDSFAVSESAVAVLLPVATDALTVTDAGTGQVLAVATDSWALSEASVSTLGEAISTLEDLSFSDALTTLLATAVATDSGTLSEATALPVDASASDSATLSEARAAFAAVVAVDAFSVGEVATPTSESSGNVTGSDAFAVSESIATIPLVAVATDSLTVTDSIETLGTIAQTDSAVLSEATATGADLTGVALYTSLTIAPRLTVNTSAGRISVTCDSTYITCDSTIITLDGSYVGGILPDRVGFRAAFPAEAEIDDRLLATVDLD